MAGFENVRPRVYRPVPSTTAQVRGQEPRTHRPDKRIVLVILVVLVVLAASYWLVREGGHESPTADVNGNHPPVVRSIVISPNPIVLSSPVSVTVDAQDVDRDPVTLRYRWFANGKFVAEQSTDVMDAKPFKRGDRVTVEVLPSDGKGEGRGLVSAPVIVANTGPMVSSLSVVLDEPPSRVATASAEIMDPDGDPVTISYRWYKGQEVVKEGEDNRLDVSALKTKDTVQVEVIASDGISAPTIVKSSTYAMNNTPPKIVSTPSPMSQAGQYTYQVQAQDPDDDAVAFSLEAGPSGMTIDAQSGMLRWSPAGDAVGVQHVRVMAKDSRGGFATQEFELSISAPPKPS